LQPLRIDVATASPLTLGKRPEALQASAGLVVAPWLMGH
jgi:hypothetical protein